MKSENLFLGLLILAVTVSVFIAGCTQQTITEREVAKNFVENSPTYKFDGKDLEYVNSKNLDCKECFEFTFNFTSTHGGYGNRSGKIVTQVLTPHIAVITVKNKTVTQAILDGKWDMLKQEPIEQNTEKITKTKAKNFVENSETYKFDGFDLDLNETLYPDTCENCYQFVFNFKSRHAGYGNRSGQMLAQVITPHTATITIKNSKVTKAILDGKWDMIQQTPLTQTPNPASVYCGQELNGTVIILDKPNGQVGYCKFNNQTCEEWALYESNGTDCVPLNETE